jgi:hypothetical protein
MSKPEALQLTGVFMDRLQACIGMPIVVYVRGVHAALMAGFGPGVGVPCPGMGPGAGFGPGGPGGFMPGFGPGFPGTIEAQRRRPPHCPDPCPEPDHPKDGMGTVAIQGVLAFAGTDFMSVNTGLNNFHEVVIPYNAVGMVICGLNQMV